MKLAFESAYQTVLTYAPPQVQEVLRQQIPKIHESIEREAQKFGSELGTFLSGEVNKLGEEVKNEGKAARAELKSIVKKLKNNTNATTADVDKATDALKEAMDEYEKKWRGYGEKLRAVAEQAIKKVGIPF